MHDEILMARGYPLVEPLPLPKQGLVGNLNCGTSGHRITIERQKAEGAKLPDGLVERKLINRQII
jgi:hypothetical protein